MHCRHQVGKLFQCGHVGRLKCLAAGARGLSSALRQDSRGHESFLDRDLNVLGAANLQVVLSKPRSHVLFLSLRFVPAVDPMFN